MKRKITMNGHSGKAVAEVFDDFVISQTAQGLSEITLLISWPFFFLMNLEY